MAHELQSAAIVMRRCGGPDVLRQEIVASPSLRPDEIRIRSIGSAVNHSDLALGRHNGSAYLTQIRGPCNTDPQKPIVATVQRWLCAQKPLPPQGSSHG
jgi:hypothetical protein